MAAKKGVPNPNAGRRPGSVTKLTRKLANDLIRQGYAPLEIMISNMMFWHKSAESIARKIELLSNEISESGEEKAKHEIYSDLVRSFLTARENSQKCAVEAAPYCHPRLQSVALKPDGDTAMEFTMKLGPLRKGEDRSFRHKLNTGSSAPQINKSSDQSTSCNRKHSQQRRHGNG
jgi:hypothetical protein